jgi:hypothetical protein
LKFHDFNKKNKTEALFIFNGGLSGRARFKKLASGKFLAGEREQS